MTRLLDANACIRYLNGRSALLRQRLMAHPPSDIAVCSIAKAEMYAGALRSTEPSQSRARQVEFQGGFVSLPFDDTAAEEAARIKAHLFAVGMPIGPYDIQIAAIALANNLILVTHDTSEFARVPGLQIEDWEV